MAFPNFITSNENLLAGGIDSYFPKMPPPPRWFATAALTRYFPLYDTAARIVRMCKSTDGGATWATVDDAHAPVVPADGSGGPRPQVYEYDNACYDPVTGRVFVVFWNTGFTVSVKPFNTAAGPQQDKWGTEIVSTITYLSDVFGVGEPVGSFACAWRPNDGAVYMAFAAGETDDTDPIHCFAAKCLVDGVGWGSLFRITGSFQDGKVWGMGGFGVDTAGNIHFLEMSQERGANAIVAYTAPVIPPDLQGTLTTVAIVQGGAGYATAGPTIDLPATGVGVGTAVVRFNVDPITGALSNPVIISTGTNWPNPAGTYVVEGINGSYNLFHRVIRPDDSLSAGQFLATNVGINAPPFTRCADFDISNNVMRTTYVNQTLPTVVPHVLRAPVGEAPLWEDTTPLGLLGPQGTNVQISDIIGVVAARGWSVSINANPDTPANNGQAYWELAALPGDYLFFSYSPLGGPSTTINYSYLSSSGIGGAWSAETIIGTIGLPALATLGISAASVPIGFPPPPPPGPVAIALFFEGILRVPVRQNKNWLADRMKQLRDLLK